MVVAAIYYRQSVWMAFPTILTTLDRDPNSDIFRNTGTVDVSLDGKTLYIHRWLTDDPDNATLADVNPYLGRDSEYPGRLLAVPLDENGIPNILIDNNGTPGDPLDDVLTNLQSIITAHDNTTAERNLRSGS